MDEHGTESETVIATCRMENGAPAVRQFGYYRFHQDSERFMVSVAPADPGDQAAIVSGSLDMTVGEFLDRMRQHGSTMMGALLGP